MAINKILYECLSRKFANRGGVVIANEGKAMSSHYAPDIFTERNKMHISSWGESYRICCPFCTDTRHRLYISHTWGIYDEVTNSRNLHLIKCFNTDGRLDHCLAEPGRREQLEQDVYLWTTRPRKHELVAAPQKVYVPVEIDWPGLCLPINSLPDKHEAVQYLVSRGFDVNHLFAEYGIRYCESASPLYYLAQGRIIIPIYYKSQMVCWQCRYVGDVDWKALKIRKYWNTPDLPMHNFLYNYDKARNSPIVVLTEGVTDALKVGPWAVSIFGKSLSEYQTKLVCSTWQRGLAVVMLDKDAAKESARICVTLQPYFKDRLLEIIPTNTKDPGDCTCEEIWTNIRQVASSRNIDLDQYFGKK